MSQLSSAVDTSAPSRARPAVTGVVPKSPVPKHSPASPRDPLWLKVVAATFYGACALVVFWGWEVRDQRYISAEFGLGYTLGIVGTTLMALLLLYPARKRMRAFRNLGPVRYWFRVHMLFGVIGPILVLFHANFTLGSFNSRTVLFATLVVSISGFFGRYFYARIHHGLYGRRASLEELRRDFLATRDKESVFADILPGVLDQLTRVERPLLTQLHPGIGQALVAGFATRWTYLRVRLLLRRALSTAAATSSLIARERDRLERNCLRYVSGRLRELRSFAQFLMFERLFSIWHVVHYPLFLVLVVAVIVHIVAVHMY